MTSDLKTEKFIQEKIEEVLIQKQFSYTLVALYLILFAFFVVLVSQSTISENKSMGVKSGLKSAFLGQATSLLTDANVNADKLKGLGGTSIDDRFFKQFSYLFEESEKKSLDITELREEGVVLTLPAVNIFNYHSGRELEINESRERFLDLLSEGLLKTYGQGEYVQAEFVFGISSYANKASRQVNVKRAGVLVRRLIDRAVDPSHLLIGLEEGHPGRIKVILKMKKKSSLRGIN